MSKYSTINDEERSTRSWSWVKRARKREACIVVCGARCEGIDGWSRSTVVERGRLNG